MKPKISAVVAMDEKRGIGKGNLIPWRIPADLAHLKKLTEGQIAILGRKSYDSMVYYYNKSGKPMPARLYAIVTRDKNYIPARENARIFSSIDEAIDELGQQADELFIIGGAQIFHETFDRLDRLYLTIIEGDYDADTFFPDYSTFTHVIREEEGTQNGYTFRWITLEKKAS